MTLALLRVSYTALDIPMSKKENFTAMTNKDRCFFFLRSREIVGVSAKRERAKKGRQNSNKLIKCGAFSGVCSASCAHISLFVHIRLAKRYLQACPPLHIHILVNKRAEDL